MTVLSKNQQLQNDMLAQMSRPDLSVWEGIEASASETWRAGPSAAIGRAVDSIFDTSEKITPEEANNMFGLGGTEAEFKPDEDLTVDSAKARAKDFHNLRMNQIIQETVNQDSPIMGRVTQFGASLAASMADPTLLAANVAGAGLIGAGAKAFANSSRMFNAVYKASPSAAKMMLTAYGDDITRSLSTVVAREGLENFAGSILEEGIIQWGNDIGDERMARQYTIQESMQNLLVGTFMGTGLSSVMARDGRKAIANKMFHDWGDDAPDFFKANSLMGAIESYAGHEKGNLEATLMNMERFGARPWYPEANADPTKAYISITEDGSSFTFSHRGKGQVLTENLHHALNSGQKVVELDLTNSKIARSEDFAVDGKQTGLGRAVMNSLVKDITHHAIHHTDGTKLTRAIAITLDPEIDAANMARGTTADMTAALADVLSGKNLEEMLSTVHDILARAGANYIPSKSVEKVLDKSGFHGYRFEGKGFDGKAAYGGVYINSTAAESIPRIREMDTPQPDQLAKSKWLLQQEQVFKTHKDWVQLKAKSLKADADDLRQQMGLPKETPLDDPQAGKKDHIQEALASTKERVTALENTEQTILAEIENLKATGKEIDPDIEASLALLQAIKEGKDTGTILKETEEMVTSFSECLLTNALKGLT
jgi:hypothetical protein